MSYYVVYSKKVARELERQGFVVKRVEPNTKDPARVVYLFDDDAELRRAISPLINRK